MYEGSVTTTGTVKEEDRRKEVQKDTDRGVKYRDRSVVEECTREVWWGR